MFTNVNPFLTNCVHLYVQAPVPVKLTVKKMVRIILSTQILKIYFHVVLLNTLTIFQKAFLIQHLIISHSNISRLGQIGWWPVWCPVAIWCTACSSRSPSLLWSLFLFLNTLSWATFTFFRKKSSMFNVSSRSIRRWALCPNVHSGQAAISRQYTTTPRGKTRLLKGDVSHRRKLCWCHAVFLLGAR